MEWSRIKTIILIILAVTNVSLLGFLVQRELQVQNARQEARQNSIQFLENNGVTVEDETVPEEMTLLPQTVEWDREQEREAASVLLGGEVQEQAWSDEIYRYYNETGSIQFHRDGTTVLYEQPVTFYQAVMGAELEIPTIDGKVKYNLPAGTQTGTTFRLRGKGIPELRGRGRGDQYVTVRVQIPTSLNGEQKEALRAFAEAMGEDVSEESGLKGFFDKHKKRK